MTVKLLNSCIYHVVEPTECVLHLMRFDLSLSSLKVSLDYESFVRFRSDSAYANPLVICIIFHLMAL